MENLKLYDWQYTVKQSIHDFKLGDEVFLRSNPEVRMKIFWLKKDTVCTCWKLIKGGCGGYGEFIPETLLKFEYACLVTHGNSNYKFCLN